MLDSTALLVLLLLALCGLGAWGAPAAPAASGRISVEGERRGSDARLTIAGRAQRSAGTTTVRITPGPIGMACGVPALRSGGRLVGDSADGFRWTALSPLRPGTRFGHGRAFSMTGSLSLPSDGAVRLCVHLVTVGVRPRVLETASVEVRSRASGFAAPFVGERAAPIVGPVVHAILPVVVLLVLFVLLRRLVLRRREVRQPVPLAPALRRPSVGHRSTSSAGEGDHEDQLGDQGGGEPVGDYGDLKGLPAMPSWIVVPDVVPDELLRGAGGGGDPTAPPPPPAWIAAARARSTTPEAAAPPPSSRRSVLVRFTPVGRAASRAVRRAASDLRNEAERVIAPRRFGPGSEVRIVVAREGRLAFLLLPVVGAPDQGDVERAVCVSLDARDRLLGGLAPIPVLVHAGAIELASAPAVAFDAGPDYAAHQVWSVPAARAESFVRGRTPVRRTARTPTSHGS